MSHRFDPGKYHRHSIRLKDYDYRWAGAYFVTIVTHQRECLFENKILRRLVEANWLAIPSHFPNATPDEWVVMPNHLHGIIILDGDIRRGDAFARESETETTRPLSQQDGQAKGMVANASPSHMPTRPQPGSLGAIVGNFKSVTTRRINAIRGTPGTEVWQRNYCEHIVRDQYDLDRIREYIAANPEHWEMDHENASKISDSVSWSLEEEQWFGKIR